MGSLKGLGLRGLFVTFATPWAIADTINRCPRVPPRSATSFGMSSARRSYDAFDFKADDSGFGPAS